MDCGPPGSSVYGFLHRQDNGVDCFSNGVFLTQRLNWVSCIVGTIFTIWATREAQMSLTWSSMEIFESNVSLNSKIREVLSWRSCILMKRLEHRRIQYRRGAKVDRVQFSSVTVVSDSLQPHGLQHTRLPCSSPTLGPCSDLCPLSQWFHPTISSSSPAFNLSQHQSLFQWVSTLHQVAKVLQLQLQHQFFQWIFRADFL